MRGYVHNGVFKDGDRLTVGVFEPYFAHGHGLFETLRAHDGRALFVRRHWERMAGTAQKLELAFPFDVDTVNGWTETVLQKTGLENARIRYQLLCRADGACDFLVTAEDVARAVEMGPEVAIGPVSALFNGQSAMPGLKTTNYMVNRLAETEGRKRGLDEVIFTLEDGTALEGARTTLFAIKNGVLLTTPLTLPILPGVTRAVVLQLARSSEIPVEEAPFALIDVPTMDEAFLTGSVSGIRPVARLEDRRPEQCPGPLTRRLAKAYWQLIASQPDA